MWCLKVNSATYIRACKIPSFPRCTLIRVFILQDFTQATLVIEHKASPIQALTVLCSPCYIYITP